MERQSKRSICQAGEIKRERKDRGSFQVLNGKTIEKIDLSGWRNKKRKK